MDPSVLNVVLYLYEHYLEDNPEAPPRAALENILHSGGVSALKATQALDWLEGLGAKAPPPVRGHAGSRRVYSGVELARLTQEARGLLMHLEHIEVLGAGERELAIERALALDEYEIGTEAMQWVVLLTLYHLPDHEDVFARMEEFCYSDSETELH